MVILMIVMMQMLNGDAADDTAAYDDAAADDTAAPDSDDDDNDNDAKMGMIAVVALQFSSLLTDLDYPAFWKQSNWYTSYRKDDDLNGDDDDKDHYSDGIDVANSA